MSTREFPAPGPGAGITSQIEFNRAQPVILRNSRFLIGVTLFGSLTAAIFAVLLFYILTIAGLFVLRRTRPDMERPYKAFGYPVLPAIYILAAGLIEVLLLLYKPNYTWPGLIIVLLGLPVYFIWRKKATI